ncbi:interleukin-13 receptor subunit alpha-1 [Notolabrus celidotus]|uniref:interleukin-13 receptor subunit alpha-1 n=1 Tax=Notolabrus celidotus TaxID=1203425 RepID=UPI00148FBE5D|nr:interleukin-13 receptor subunit alpha-1 [Notolabrus celidotus]
MIQSLDLVFVCCLFLRVEPLIGTISPPTNLSLTWTSDFNLKLSWAPPSHPMDHCRYEVKTKSNVKWSEDTTITNQTSLTRFRVLEGGLLHLSVRTVCGENRSNWVSNKTPETALVKDLQCFIHSSKLTRCSWLNATKASDFHFFYRLEDLSSNESYNNKSKTITQECQPYKDPGGIRTGCDLLAKTTQSMIIIITGTLDSKPFRNTFSRKLHVKPPALTWTVTKTKKEFIIKWIPPEVLDLSDWKFVVNYTECNELKPEKEIPGETSLKLPMVSRCQYQMSIRAVADGRGETPWTEEKYFDADTDPYRMIYAAVIIPLIFAGLAAFAFVFCRKNKEHIFPEIPEPKFLITDIYNNNNNKIHNLCIPEEEEDNCEITLVVDPQTDKLYN